MAASAVASEVGGSGVGADDRFLPLPAPSRGSRA